MFKRRVWIGGVVICLLYWGTWHSYHDDLEKGIAVDPLIKNAINFCLLAGVSLTGLYGWYKHCQPWVGRLWILIYCCVIGGITFSGVIDQYFISISDGSIRNMISGLRLFFTSPVPYGVLVFLARRAGRNKNGAPREIAT